MKNYINQKNFIFLLVVFTLIKIIFSFLYGDNFLVFEWKIILKNIINHQIFGYHDIFDEVVPSVYMPPLYVYFLYFFSLIGFSEIVNVKIILLFQCLVSGVSVFYFYKILKLFFNDKISLLISLIYFFYPLNYYSSSQVSSVSLQVSLFIFFMFFYLNAKSTRDFFLLGVFSSLMCLVRGEFWLILIIMFILKTIKKNISIKNFIISTITIVFLLSPTLIRNYIHFEQFILTKSSGYNLWRGNSSALLVTGQNKDTKEIKDFKKSLKIKLQKEKELSKYEIFIDEYYFDIAKKNILERPGLYIVHYFKKFFAFSIFNPFSDYPNYFHPLVIIPEILISIIALLGIIVNIFSKNRNIEVLLLTLYYLFLIPVFFVLPRYKLFLLPMYFIFVAYFFTFISSRIFSKKR